MAWNLTNPGLSYENPPQTDPNSGMQINVPALLKFFKNPKVAMDQANQALQSVPPQSLNVTPPEVTGSTAGPDLPPGPLGMPGSSVQGPEPTAPNLQFSGGAASLTQPPANLPQFVQPKFQDTLTQPNGTPTPINTAQTKLGKLLAVIKMAAEGAADGSQAGTFGGGFAAAEQGPIQKMLMQQNLQRGQIENQLQQAQVSMLPWQRMQQIAALQKSQADIGRTQAETAAIPTKTALEQAQAISARFKEDPGSGTLIDLQSGQPVNGGQMVPVQTKEIADVLNVPVGTQVPLGRLSKAADLLTKGISNVTTEQGVFERNRITGKNTRLGDNPRMVFSPENRIVQVADPNNPGNTTFAKAGDAVKQNMAGPMSASVQIPKAVLKWATTGKGGEQGGAFNTALQHADLLETAMKALNNGDVQTLNSLKNRFKTEFGSPDVTNYQTIANAYSREITKMLSAGHITDSEISTQGATLPAKASPEQIQGAIDSYRALAGSKMKVLYDQYQKGMQGQPNFTNGSVQQQTATGPNGHKIVVQNGKWVDASTGNPIQ